MKIRTPQHRRPVLNAKAAGRGPRAVTGGKRAPNPLRVDPTRTASLRRAFAAEIKRRFARLRLKVVDLVLKEDTFGLTAGTGRIADLMREPKMPVLRVNALTANQRWRFHDNAAKLQAFKSWLRTQIQQDVLGRPEDDIWRLYVEEGFRKGAGRAFDDVNRKRARWAPGEGDFYRGSKEQFLRDSFARPVAVEKVKLLAGRTYDDLEGVTEAMSRQMTRHLTDGLVLGRGPREIARDLAADVDGIGAARALTISRTELIRAHADGQLLALEELGVEEVGVAVEWSTAGDEKVCDKCSPLEGVVLKLEEAKGMIPRHPSCRCAWIPANAGESEEGQKSTQSAIESAIRTSARRSDGDPEPGVGDWVGQDKDIAASRPESILNARSPIPPLTAADLKALLRTTGAAKPEATAGADLSEELVAFSRWAVNKFCPTGPGGGVDPSCGEGEGGAAVPEKTPSEKAARAKAAHVLVDKSIQRYAEEHSEPRFAKVVGGHSLPDGEPMDVVTKDGDGIELKTMVVGKDDKLTMNTYAQVRKVMWEKESGKTFHTVVSDDRKVFNAKGEGKHDDSKRVYYYRRGVAGSARISSMHRCKDEAELKRLLKAPEGELPSGAQRTDSKLRVGKWKAFKDDEGKGFENAKTGQVVRAKK